MSGDTSNPNGAHHRSRLAFAWEMARGDRTAWFTTVINALFTHLFRALLPIIYALIVDEVIVRGELSLVPAIALCFGILLVANEGLFAIGHVSWVYKITDFDSKVRRRLFSRILDAKTELLERRRTGDLAETVETDANQITWYVDVFAVWIPDALIALVIALIFMTAISPIVALMAAVAAPLSAFVSHRMALRGRRIADEYREQVRCSLELAVRDHTGCCGHPTARRHQYGGTLARGPAESVDRPQGACVDRGALFRPGPRARGTHAGDRVLSRGQRARALRPALPGRICRPCRLLRDRPQRGHRAQQHAVQNAPVHRRRGPDPQRRRAGRGERRRTAP